MKVQAFNGFSLKTNLKPSGDQPKAIAELLSNLEVGVKEQVLLGATGTGKTFTIANVIEKYNKPTLIIAHNKILAAQLYRELKELFPENAVEYFISYYDYYQPEAYIPEKDLYIEKDASINEILERYRHSATVSVLERRDVIVVASVSCIYGLGSPEAYYSLRISLEVGQRLSISRLTRKLVEIGYERNDYAIRRATFSVKGNAVEIVPSDMEDQLLRIEFWDDEIDSITLMDALNRHRIKDLKKVVLFPASHYIARFQKLSTHHKLSPPYHITPSSTYHILPPQTPLPSHCLFSPSISCTFTFSGLSTSHGGSRPILCRRFWHRCGQKGRPYSTPQGHRGHKGLF